MLIAPDSFKGTYSSLEVANAIARGAGGGDVCPVGDGGEGTLDAILNARAGATTTLSVHDPLGRPINATIGIFDAGESAIVEAATAAGLGLVEPEHRDAEAASSFGVGELIALAVDAGARHVIVTVGGSATTDGGLGAIEAIEAAGGLRGARLTVATDVTTAFEDAAEVYGPQKGATREGVVRLTARLHALATSLPKDPRGITSTGAAGGLAGGLWATYDATLVSGASWVLDTIGFNDRLRCVRAVVTGEGRLDAQTFEGKLVGEVAARARRAGKAVHAVVGSSSLSDTEAAQLGLATVTVASSIEAIQAAGAAIAPDQPDARP